MQKSKQEVIKCASLVKLIVLGFNDTSTLEGHFVLSPRKREKRDRRDSRGDEREGRKKNRNESEETNECPSDLKIHDTFTPTDRTTPTPL